MLRVICKPEEHVDHGIWASRSHLDCPIPKQVGDWLTNVPTRGMPHLCSARPLPACRLRLSSPPPWRQSQPCGRAGFPCHIRLRKCNADYYHLPLLDHVLGRVPAHLSCCPITIGTLPHT